MRMKLRQKACKKHQKRKETKDKFPKEQVENSDLSNPVLNKILTSHE